MQRASSCSSGRHANTSTDTSTSRGDVGVDVNGPAGSMRRREREREVGQLERPFFRAERPVRLFFLLRGWRCLVLCCRSSRILLLLLKLLGLVLLQLLPTIATDSNLKA